MPKKCGACGGPNSARTPLISYTRSAGVADVTILAQSMLTMMQEDALRKVLIFADSRQEAAFQAGWMQRRARRFRMRHIAYNLAREEGRAMGWEAFIDYLIARGREVGILKRSDFESSKQEMEVGWFLTEEFASGLQRRSNLEQLGLLRVVYGGLDTVDDPFFADWAARLDTTPSGVLDCALTLLDTFRRRGMLSDPLLARYWSVYDPEVANGLINIPDFYRPQAMVLEHRTKSPHLVGWIAENGRAHAQLIVERAFGKSGASRDSFLRALWDWFVQQEYLEPVELVQRRGGSLGAIPNLPDSVYQVNVNRVGLEGLDASATQYVCSHCHRALQVNLPSGACPEYRCKGRLAEQRRDEEHFDVVQYTRYDFIPLAAREHSGQVSHKRRMEAEREFKSEGGLVNAIVATPTLEMGVDIGKLEMLVMRNVPPTPANYAQRSGRAGRRHRIAAVFAYAGGSQHDRYFYNSPPEMIAGSVRVPAFSMRNAPLIRKHVHSATLTALRDLARKPEEVEILKTAFPVYISDYLAEWHLDGEKRRPHYHKNPPQFDLLADLIRKYRSQILGRLEQLFSQFWPEEDREAVSRDTLAQHLDDMANQLQAHIHLLFVQFKTYREELGRLRDIEARDEGLTVEDRKLRQKLEQARDRYLRDDINNYTLSWLSMDGFFPGYALSRESVQATCLQPLLDLSRPAVTALRELTPANWVYADGKVFGVQRLNFGKLKARDERFTSDLLREEMLYDSETRRLYDPSRLTREGAAGNGRQVISYQLTDVELERVQDIDDRRETRRRIAFESAGMLLNQHSGGEQGELGDRHYRHVLQDTVRLVNMGPIRIGPSAIQGFPICPVCGESRSPQSTELEIDRFREAHRERCQVADILFVALHVDLQSDILEFGPYDELAEAVNAYEGILAGARHVLDMNEDDLEGLITTDEHGGIWATLYDPLPGGTGFLQQLLVYWDTICQKGAEALGKCTCQRACYQCLQHFRNQQHHAVLDRFLATDLLHELSGNTRRLSTIPPAVQKIQPDNKEAEAESIAEQHFLKMLQRHAFPQPDKAQHHVDLGNGNHTVADFAYMQGKVLVFIDGTSPELHGDPQRAHKDKLKRAQAQLLGWNIVEITAQELNDQQALSMKLEYIALYLKGQS